MGHRTYILVQPHADAANRLEALIGSGWLIYRARCRYGLQGLGIGRLAAQVSVIGMGMGIGIGIGTHKSKGSLRPMTA